MNKKNIKVASIIMVSILLYRWFALWAYQSFFLPSINNVIKNNFPLITWIISGGIILFIVLNLY